MRKIYLIRHGEIQNEHKCIGLTDLPLQKQGIDDSKRLKKCLTVLENFELFSSPLLRCRQTAMIIAPEKKIQICDSLREMSVGIWENKTFEEIKAIYPEMYKERGNHLGYYTIPGGESFFEAGRRFERALNGIRTYTEKDIVIVTHSGVIKSYLCMLSEVSLDNISQFSIPNNSISLLEDSDKLNIIKTGFRSHSMLCHQTCAGLNEKYRTSVKMRLHMKAVADYANVLSYKLNINGCKINRELLFYSALLHDIARNKPNHALEGADILRREGYFEVAKIVERHHNLTLMEAENINETSLLFYIDKRVKEQNLVTLEERFEASKKKCKTEIELLCHKEQYLSAIKIENMIKMKIGEEIL